VIVDYDPSWPLRFQLERERVRGALGAHALRIEHVGSTAVPGLAAKPIVDLLVTVDDPDDERVTAPALRSAGYELKVREPGHRMFRAADRGVHVHLWRQSDPLVVRQLKFRDRLRSSPADRHAYEQLKRDLAAREWSDMNDYANAKGKLIKEILAKTDPWSP
jgi:GrpB-like predicted nucleotidyltransferase (UPF0157 family)